MHNYPVPWILETRCRKAVWMLRGRLLTLYLRVHGCKVGKSLKCKDWPIFRQVPWKNIVLGSNITVGYRVVLDVHLGAMLAIGDHVNLTQDLLIGCGSEVQIGAYSGIGEYSSIRDGEHGYSADELIHGQKTTYKSITIGTDVQISKGCLVLPGSQLPDGVLIGAHSSVTANSRLVAYGIFLGNPVKMIGKRVPKSEIKR
ncbi:MAG: acyltransferase [Bacteroidetes bacterium]|nr:acyltransferase [Bacteroidota bacterium]